MANVSEEENDCQDYSKAEDWNEEEMKWGVKAGVAGESLGRLCHDGSLFGLKV
jgi:hypothetical protein